jgi:ParB-like chromosome segregation protein Spo0J
MTNSNQSERNLAVVYVPVDQLINPDYNPRSWSEQNTTELKTSIARYGIVDPLLVNSADERKNIVIGGNFRLKVLKELGYTEVPVVYIHIPDINKEKELCIRLNKNQGEWDLELLSKFDESFLEDIGFDSVELDSIF